MTLLATAAGAYRIVTLTAYLDDPHLIKVSPAELVILLAAAALVAPDAAPPRQPWPVARQRGSPARRLVAAAGLSL